MNDMVKAIESGNLYCKPCASSALQDSDNPLEGEIENLVDPTVCSYCGIDADTTNLPMIAGLPSCNKCEHFFKNRPFPNWIKISVLSILALVILSVAWNLRFIRGYIEMNNSFKALSQADLSLASTSMLSAAIHVPENADLKLLANYMEGLFLLEQDHCAKALEKLEQCENRLPENYGVEGKILQAKIGVAFDSQDYNGFLEYAKKLELMYPKDYMAQAMVSSAYACKYAETGDDKFREESMNFLSKSKETAADDTYYKEYEQRILHRLYTKEIISRDEFIEKFPNGWANNEN